MFKRWSKEDRGSWERSEVMKELESQILAKYAMVEKLAQAKTSLPNPAEVKEVTKAVSELNTEANKLSQTLSSSADDGVTKKSCTCDDTSDQMCAACGDNYSDDEVALAKEEILNELQKMADEAIISGNIKLAYKIERTISEMKED